MIEKDTWWTCVDTGLFSKLAAVVVNALLKTLKTIKQDGTSHSALVSGFGAELEDGKGWMRVDEVG